VEQRLPGSREKAINRDTKREATSIEVMDLRNENEELKRVVAEQTLRLRVLKKSLKGLK